MTPANTARQVTVTGRRTAQRKPPGRGAGWGFRETKRRTELRLERTAVSHATKNSAMVGIQVGPPPTLPPSWLRLAPRGGPGPRCTTRRPPTGIHNLSDRDSRTENTARPLVMTRVQPWWRDCAGHSQDDHAVAVWGGTGFLDDAAVPGFRRRDGDPAFGIPDPRATCEWVLVPLHGFDLSPELVRTGWLGRAPSQLP